MLTDSDRMQAAAVDRPTQHAQEETPADTPGSGVCKRGHPDAAVSATEVQYVAGLLLS